MMFQVLEGDCLEVLKTMPDCSVDAVVTDPPYGLSQHTPEQVKDCLLAWCKGEVYQPKGKGFMGKKWDAWVPGPEVWKEVLRVLKPGGHALVFAGTRSMDLMSMSLRLAGFELRDSIGHAYDDSDSDSGAAPLLAWVHGQGFPKNLDIGKAIDKLHGAEREVVEVVYNFPGEKRNCMAGDFSGDRKITAPATPDAEKWDGFGTALKPSFEPLILAQKAFNPVLDYAIIELVDTKIELFLCLFLLCVNSADKVLKLSHLESKETPVSVAVNAAMIHGLLSGELSEKMDTFKSQEAVLMSLSIAILWKTILGEVLTKQSTFTTKMAIEVTTGLKILNSLLSTTIPDSIIKEETLMRGQWRNASNVEMSLSAEKESWDDTLKRFAVELATLKTEDGGGSAKIAENHFTTTTQIVFTALLDVIGSITESNSPLLSLSSALNVDALSLGKTFIKENANASLVLTQLIASLNGIGEQSKKTLTTNFEPILLCRKPLEGTVAENVLKHGTGGLNIGACRIPTDDKLGGGGTSGAVARHEGYRRPWMEDEAKLKKHAEICAENIQRAEQLGRWPANVVLTCSCSADHSESCPVSQFPLVNGPWGKDGNGALNGKSSMFSIGGVNSQNELRGKESGSAARFFYTAKASKRDRDEGLENLPKTVTDDGRNKSIDNPYQRGETLRHNPHPTVKSTHLMRWLVRLLGVPGGVILDPFCGSGSTGKASVLEGFEFIGIEQDPESVMVARARIAWAAGEPAPTLPPSAENEEQETAVTAPERPKQLSLFGV